MPEDRTHDNQTTNSSSELPTAKQSLTPIGQPAQEKSESRSRPSQGKRRACIRWLKIWSPIILSAIVAVEIGIQAYIYNGQWSVMNDALTEAEKQTQATQQALTLTRDNFRREQRPYIWLTRPGAPDFILNQAESPSLQVVWTWHYSNYGRTPAHNVRFENYIKVGNRAFAKSFGPFRGLGIGAPLPPNKEDFYSVISPPGISEEEHGILLKTDQSVIIRGRIEYTDASQEKYETGFCIGRLANGTIQYCREGNYIK